MLRLKNEIKQTKNIFIAFLIILFFLPILLLFQNNISNLENVNKCETYAASLNISSEKVFKLSQLNRKFIFNDENLTINSVLIEDIPNSINCLGKIWEVDSKNNIIFIASNKAIFQIYKFLGYIFIFFYLFKIKALNLLTLFFTNLIFTISLNYIFNFNFRFNQDLKFYSIQLEILDSVMVSLVFFGLIKFFEKEYVSNASFVPLNFQIRKNIFIIFSSLYLTRILYILSTPFQTVDVIQEWLINYNYGFIRRGLIGTLLIEIIEYLKLDVQIFIYLLLFVLYSIFFLLLFKILKNKTFDFYSLLILLSPLFLNYNLFLKSTILLPKELLGYISLLIFLQFQITNKKIILFLFVLIYAMSVLSHEVNLILLPTIFYISFFKSPQRVNKITFLLILILSILILIMIFNIQTDKASDSLCLETYSKFTPDLGCKKSEILKTKFLDNIENVKINIFSSEMYKYYILTYSLTILFGFIPFIFNGWMGENSLYVTLLLISFCFLSVIGLDWGRWINIIFTHLCIYFIFFDLEKYQKNTIGINNFFQITLLIFYSTYWSTPQCCVNKYTFTSQINHVFNNFSIYMLITLLIFFVSKNIKNYKFLHSIFGLNSIKKHSSE